MSDPRVRLFVALELPDEVRDLLVSWRDEAVGQMGGLRLLEAEQLHVTLCFLGWQPADATEAIAAACRAAASPRALSVRVADAVWLPPRRPRVLAVRLDDPDGGLVRLQSELSDRLRDGRWYAPERRPYMPHVTVARTRRGAAVRPIALPAPPSLSFTARQITLFRSQLGASGARYAPLARVSLG